MQHADFDNLDAFIEAALSDEPIRPVPFGFARAVHERLTLQRRIETERRRLRQTLIGGGTLLLVACIGFFALGLRWASTLAADVPGLHGYIDGMTAPYAAWGTPIAGIAVLATVVLVLAAAAQYMRPRQQPAALA